MKGHMLTCHPVLFDVFSNETELDEAFSLLVFFFLLLLFCSGSDGQTCPCSIKPRSDEDCVPLHFLMHLDTRATRQRGYFLLRIAHL